MAGGVMRICLASLALALAACQGGVINNATPDATPLPPDAPAQPNYLGQVCSDAAPCPSGWDCLTQPGGNGSWCTRTCTGQTDPVCDANYLGPGFGACILSPQGQTTKVCAVVCQDPAGAPDICPSGTACNGSCLAPLQCTGVITDGGGIEVGRSCQ